MRRVRVLASLSLLALLLVAGPACDTDQPMNGGQKNFTLAFNAQSPTKVFDVWTLSEDQNRNDQLDPGEDVIFNGRIDTGVWCEDTGQISDAGVPWSYSLRIDLIRAGATTRETVYTSGGLSDSYPNQTPFDTQVQATLADKTVVIGANSWLVWDGQRITQGNRRLLDAAFGVSPTPDNLPVCLVNAQGLDDPEVAGGAPPYSIQLSPGDTIQIQARKEPKGQSPVIFNPDPQSPDTPRLQALPSLDGSPATGTGSMVTGSEDGTGVSFYVTLR